MLMPGRWVGTSASVMPTVAVPSMSAISVADQAIRVAQLECKAHHGRDRAERDIALVPIEPDAEHVAAFVAAAADHAGIGHRRGIRAGLGTGQAEAGNLLAASQPRQPVILLLFGAELHQQLAGPERVRHHGGARGTDRARRQLADHFRVRIGREAEAAVRLRDDHREEFFLLQEPPDFRRQVAQLPIDLPFVDHAAEVFHRAGEELLLLWRQPCRREGEELAPVGIAGEQLGVPPHVAGFDGFALGGGQPRQRMLRQAKDRLGDPVPPERRMGHGISPFWVAMRSAVAVAEGFMFLGAKCYFLA